MLAFWPSPPPKCTKRPASAAIIGICTGRNAVSRPRGQTNAPEAPTLSEERSDLDGSAGQGPPFTCHNTRVTLSTCAHLSVDTHVDRERTAIALRYSMPRPVTCTSLPQAPPSCVLPPLQLQSLPWGVHPVSVHSPSSLSLCLGSCNCSQCSYLTSPLRRGEFNPVAVNFLSFQPQATSPHPRLQLPALPATLVAHHLLTLQLLVEHLLLTPRY